MTNSIEKQISAKFANMGFVAALLVVSIHFHLQPEAGTVISYVWSALGIGVARIAVPFFFLTSGFFLATHVGEPGWWKRELVKRVRSLGVPYLSWCILSLLILHVTFPVLANVVHGRPLLVNTSFDLIRTFGLSPWDNPAIPAFWYIRNLFFLVLASPLIIRLGGGGV